MKDTQQPHTSSEYGVKDTAPERWQTKTEKPKGWSQFTTYLLRQVTMISLGLTAEIDSLKSKTGFKGSLIQWRKFQKQEFWSEYQAEWAKTNLKNLSVMDIGAGTGSLFNALTETGQMPARLILVELNHQFVEFLQQRVQAGNFQDQVQVVEGQFSAELAIPGLVEESLDLVTLAGVATHMEQAEFMDLLDAIDPYLKKDGCIVFSVPTSGGKLSMSGLVQQYKKRIQGRRSRRYDPQPEWLTIQLVGDITLVKVSKSA